MFYVMFEAIAYYYKNYKFKKMDDVRKQWARELFFLNEDCMPEDKGFNFVAELPKVKKNMVIFSKSESEWKILAKHFKRHKIAGKTAKSILYTGIAAVVLGFMFLPDSGDYMANVIWIVAVFFLLLYIVLAIFVRHEMKWLEKNKANYYLITLEDNENDHTFSDDDFDME